MHLLNASAFVFSFLLIFLLFVQNPHAAVLRCPRNLSRIPCFLRKRTYVLFSTIARCPPHRYQAHDSSQQIAEKQQDATDRRMVELQESSAGSAWIDVQFLKTAMEQLIECRRVLK